MGTHLRITENDIQRSVFQHIKTRGVPGLVAWHPKNASSDMRGRRRGVYAGLGVLSGVSDVHLFHDRKFYVLELKRDDKAVVDGDEQDKFLKAIAAQGGMSAWAAGLDQAIETLENWGLLRGRAA